MVQREVSGGEEKVNPGMEGIITWKAGDEGEAGAVRRGTRERNSSKDPVA